MRAWTRMPRYALSRPGSLVSRLVIATCSSSTPGGDLTYEQIAEALGIPVGTVRSRLNRVRRRLAPPGSRGTTRLTWMAKEESDAAYGTSA